ncbi:IPT/TIG domain-containing protein [Sphingobacterium chuzhouense]|uniref:IPT/TIG domain-containing protein n=1 Tax=Sphingobacterium chuzhouense TaxID=1742264 RepID=A0ABR7XNH8_9SPHI|nr:IPT/TIG domain-containing protein [Sphingobacterium chuzhouense]MBD1420693.1 IPT/TIG domain-containing protein [Sphingobacterium chuzhouense]
MKHFTFCMLLTMLLFSSCSKNNEERVALDSPLVHSIDPLEGRPGTVVTIEGENFSRLRVDNKVLFNGVEAKIIHFNENTIHVNAPEGSTDGPVAIQVAGKSVEGPEFHFIQPPPPTGETVVVKVLSFGGHATANAAANSLIPYYADLAKTRDVDFVIARELDSMTNRSGKVDRPKLFSELSGLPHYQFSRAIPADYQTGAFGLAVYSKHPLETQWSHHLENNRVLSVLHAQVTPQSRIAFAGVQMEDVTNAGGPGLRSSQATKVIDALNDVMIPTILAGGLFMLDQKPLEDPMFKIFNQEGFVPGCTSCEWTSASGTGVNRRDVIADFISYRWAREARIIKYELLETGPGSDRKPAYIEIEFSL